MNQYTGDESRTRVTPVGNARLGGSAKRGKAGEIVLNMMNQDGVRNGGYDLEQLKKSVKFATSR